MIDRLHIDNYKCFVNFEFHPQSLQLLLGPNGSGKTTVLDVLEALWDVIASGLEVSRAFPKSTLTAWDTRSDQTFEIGIKGNGGQYSYQLVIEHDRTRDLNRIKTEKLLFDQQTLYEFDGSDAHLFRDGGSAGPVFEFDWSRSAIATIPERRDNQHLTWFRRRLGRTYIFSPDPRRMLSHSEVEMDRCDRDLNHLVSWLRHLFQESVDTTNALRESLRDAIDGLVDLKIERAGETTRLLKFTFETGADGNGRSSARYDLSLDRLSEGQRNLVALFTLLHAVVQTDSTVCIDEPDNYVALREIQPWLTHLKDRVEETGCQCLLISHHPELINYLAAQHGQWFHRDSGGLVRVKPFGWDDDQALAPSEVVARDWAYEETARLEAP